MHVGAAAPDLVRRSWSACGCPEQCGLRIAISCVSTTSCGMSGQRPRKAVLVDCAGRSGAVDVETAASRYLHLRGHGPRVARATWLSSMLVFVVVFDMSSMRVGFCPVCFQCLCVGLARVFPVFCRFFVLNWAILFLIYNENAEHMPLPSGTNMETKKKPEISA